MDSDDKITPQHVEMLEELLKKQKILYTRLSLSEDPEAKLMKENIIKSAKYLNELKRYNLVFLPMLIWDMSFQTCPSSIP